MEVAEFTPNISFPNFEEMIIVLLADLQIESLLRNVVQSKTPQFKVAQMAGELIR